jgi:hypothetical protein
MVVVGDDCEVQDFERIWYKNSCYVDLKCYLTELKNVGRNLNCCHCLPWKCVTVELSGLLVTSESTRLKYRLLHQLY